MKAWAVALAVGLQLPAACDTASGSGMHARGGLSGAAQESAAGRHLGLRGGSAPGYSGLPDEELLEEPRSAQEAHILNNPLYSDCSTVDILGN